MTTQIDLDKLEQVARAATQDGWELKYLGSKIGLRVRSGYQAFINIDRCHPELAAEAKASAEFFYAANPAIVLELVRRLRAAEAPKPALTADKVIPLSVLEEIAQAHAESVPGPGGYACTESEKKAFKKAFLRRWMPKAIEATSGPNAALVEALQGMLGVWNMVCYANGWERDHVQQQKDAVAALAAAGVEVKP